jgi:hypothetical protein
LREPWNFPTVYVNPPYGIDRQHGKTIKEWIKRCEEAHRVYGSEVLALVPVATNTGHWKRYVYGRAAGICFLDEGKGAPMSCAMIYWGQNVRRFSEVFMRFGAVVNIENLKGIKIGEANQNETGQMELAVL